MNQKTSHIITGTIIILFGVGALLNALDVFPFWSTIGNWWPLFLVLAGILIFVNSPKNFIWPIVLVLVGVLLQLNGLGVITINPFELIWPAIIIAVGGSIIFHRRGGAKQVDSREGVEDVSAIFSGSETLNKSKDYQGGKATAIFGGVSIDLRDAVIKKQATLEVFALCGGIELKVPRGWKIQSNVLPILGGVESKAHSEDLKDKSPVLIITGTVALGGVEVRS